MKTDSYARMREELNIVWGQLRSAAKHLAAKKEAIIHEHMSNVMSLAREIGGQVERDASRLQNDVERFLDGQIDREELCRMFEDALKLSQDTREL
jgi:hypothetical protein